MVRVRVPAAFFCLQIRASQFAACCLDGRRHSSFQMDGVGESRTVLLGKRFPGDFWTIGPVSFVPLDAASWFWFRALSTSLGVRAVGENKS